MTWRVGSGIGSGHGLGWLIVLVMGLNLGSPALAQEDKRAAREKEAMRRLQQETQRLNGQLQAAEAERAKLSSAAGEKEKALSAAQSELKQREKSERGLRAELKTRLGKAREDLEKLELRFAEVSTQLKDANDRNARNEATLAARDGEIRALNGKLGGQRDIIARQTTMLEAAETKNRELAKIARELMHRYKDKGLMDALLQKEPFTGVEKVKVQNTLQEFEERVNSQRLALPEVGG